MRYSTRSAAVIAGLIGHAFIPTAAEAQVTGGAQPIAAAFAGTYRLAQVDSANLPFLIGEAAGCRRELTGATLTLAADATWKMDTNIRATCGEKVETKTESATGRFAGQASTVRFTLASEKAQEQKDPATLRILTLGEGTLREAILEVKLGDNKNVLRFRK